MTGSLTAKVGERMFGRWLFNQRGTSAPLGYNRRVALSFRIVRNSQFNPLLLVRMAGESNRNFSISMPKYEKGQNMSRYEYSDDHLFEKVGRANMKKPSLVIFDKDGTLICLHKMWVWWIEPFTQHLSDLLGYSIEDQLYRAIKYDTSSKSVSNHSVLAQATNANVRKALLEVVMETGVSENKASDLLELAWEREVNAKHPPLTECIEPVGDVKQLFETLKLNGIKIAICTSDCRDITMETLKMIGCFDLVDLVVCGDDEINVQKPAPDNALNICRALDVNPGDSVVIGDTTADVIMGRRAKLGLVVGVLTGAGQAHDLEPYTDYVVDDIHSLLPLIMKSKFIAP